MNMEIFRNNEFGSIRVIEEDGKYLFCGSDVAKALGYACSKSPGLRKAQECHPHALQGGPETGLPYGWRGTGGDVYPGGRRLPSDRP